MQFENESDVIAQNSKSEYLKTFLVVSFAFSFLLFALKFSLLFAICHLPSAICFSVFQS